MYIYDRLYLVCILTPVTLFSVSLIAYYYDKRNWEPVLFRVTCFVCICSLVFIGLYPRNVEPPKHYVKEMEQIEPLRQELQREIDNAYSKLTQESDSVLFSQVGQAENVLKETETIVCSVDREECSHTVKQVANKLTAVIKQLKEYK